MTAWTAPRTWVSKEKVTKAILDTHVRDNLLHLKEVVTDDVVLKALFDAANTLIKADVQDTPEGLTVAEQRLVGRITDGVITGLTGAQVMAMLSGQAGAVFSLGGQNLSYVGHIGLGNIAASATIAIRYSEDITITDNLTRAGVVVDINAAKTSADYTGIVFGGDFDVSILPANSQSWTNALGLQAVYAHMVISHPTVDYSAKTITGIVNFHATAPTLGSNGGANLPVITNHYGLYIDPISLISNSKLTNCYGIKIEDQEGGATLNYAIHTGLGLVHFGDSVDLAATKTVDGIDIKTIQTRALMFALCS